MYGGHYIQATMIFFNGKTNRELEYASKELRKRKENAGKNKSIAESELASFLLELKDEEGLLDIRRKQAQMGMNENQNIDNPQEILNYQPPENSSTGFDDEDFSDLEPFGEF